MRYDPKGYHRRPAWSVLRYSSYMILNFFCESCSICQFRFTELVIYYRLCTKSNNCKTPLQCHTQLSDVYFIYDGIVVELKLLYLAKYVLNTRVQALEYKEYSTLSDVWSFGCVLYELWSLGHKPYEDIPVKNVSRLLS